MNPKPFQAKNWRFTPEGDQCLIIRFDSTLAETDINRLCLQTAQSIANANLPGIMDIVPAFNCVGIHYQAPAWETAPYQTLCQTLDALLCKQQDTTTVINSKHIEIPVCYDPEWGIDLELVAQHCQCTPEQLIEWHTGTSVRVFMLGFAPGLPYMGMLPEKLDIPRLATPRSHVPGGSVAIANRQTIIYPNSSPGGWHIIGRTPVTLFNPNQPPYARLAPGDTVQFKAISKETFQTMLQNNAYPST